MEKEKIVSAIEMLNSITYEDGIAENAIPLINKKIIILPETEDKELILTFFQACESIPRELEEYIPDAVSDIYNILVEEEEKAKEEEEKAKEKEEKTKEAKKQTKPIKIKSTLPKNALKPFVVSKTIFGHMAEKGSGKIDAILLQGVPISLKEIAENLSTTELRVYMHVCDLPSKGAIVIVNVDSDGVKKYHIDPKNPMVSQ